MNIPLTIIKCVGISLFITILAASTHILNKQDGVLSQEYGISYESFPLMIGLMFWKHAVMLFGIFLFFDQYYGVSEE